jgi:hypothetical protein
MTLRSALYTTATLYALGGIGLMLCTPVVATDSPTPTTAITFWWSRLQPVSYAAYALEGATAFVIPDPGVPCIAPEGFYTAWETLLPLKDSDIMFRTLLEQATPAGRLYAVMGLAYTHPEVLGYTARDRETDTASVRILVWTGDKYLEGRYRIKDIVSSEALVRWLEIMHELPHTRCAA